MKTILLLALLSGLAAGADAIAQSAIDQARASESRQVEIQVNSRALVAELDAMIDEYDRNGLKGDDIKNLKSLRGVLGKLSDKDMARILDMLKQAGTENDPAVALKVIASAYSQQKGVLIEMKQILAGYASGEEAQELSKIASDLADRQAANLQTGIETARWSVTAHDQSALDSSLQGQAAEQKAISDELKLLQSKIADFAKDPNNKALTDRFNKGLEQIAVVAPILSGALDSLDQKKLFTAVTNEKTARDQMRQLARTIAPPRDDADALREAVEQLGKLISQQKEVIATTTLGVAPPIQDYIATELKGGVHGHFYRVAERNGWVHFSIEQYAAQPEVQRMYESHKAQKSHSADGLESREVDLANQSDSLSQDIAKLAQPAADALKAAIPPMQSASSLLAQKDPANAAKPETDALTYMNKALDALEQQLAAAEKAGENSGDPVADLQEMQKNAQALLQQQDALGKNTAAPKSAQQAAVAAQQQGALEKKTRQLQQKAAADAPDAAQSLSNAAGNMQKAADAMAQPGQAAQSQPQQGQAMQNLSNAVSQLGKQIAQLKQDQQQMAEAQKDLDAVEKLIAAEQSLQGDTVKAAAQEEKQRPVITALAPRQQSIGQNTDDFQKILAADPQQAGSAQKASSASGHMTAAKDQLATGAGTAANPEEGKALDDLYAIKDTLLAQVQADQSQLGQDAPANAATDQSAANAAAAVAQAQANVAQAMSNLSSPSASAQAASPAGAAPQTSPAPAANAQAAGQMAQAASAVGAAAAQAAALPPGAEQAMRAAAQAAAQAAAAAAAGQTPQAAGAGQQAQKALAQAAAALSQAQAGIAAAGSPGPPGASPGPPGTTPGPPGPSTGDGPGNTQITNGAQSVNGGDAAGRAQFLGLPMRDRATIQQSQSEKYPQQYAAKVEQYLENLANSNGRQ